MPVFIRKILSRHEISIWKRFISQPSTISQNQKDAGIKRAISEHVQGSRNAVSRYAMGKGADAFTFNLVIIPAPGKKDSSCVFDRYHVFATSLPCSDADDTVRDIPDQYRKRWGIETGYRCAKEIRPRTNSISPSIRMLLFAVSLILSVSD